MAADPPSNLWSLMEWAVQLQLSCGTQIHTPSAVLNPLRQQKNSSSLQKGCVILLPLHYSSTFSAILLKKEYLQSKNLKEQIFIKIGNTTSMKKKKLYNVSKEKHETDRKSVV